MLIGLINSQGNVPVDCGKVYDKATSSQWGDFFFFKLDVTTFAVLCFPVSES